MALRSVLCCRAALARAHTLSPPPPPLPCFHHLPFAPPPHTHPLSLRCLASSSSPPPITLQESNPPASDSPPDSSANVDSLDIRVGRILKAWKHPDAESLYVEEVDLGEPDGPRTICSGLVKYVSLEELQDLNVIVLANLKPRNMRGIKSNGMLLAASDASHENVELLIPPEGSIPGERAWFGTDADKETQGEAAAPNQVQKKKIWEGIQPHLKTSEELVVTFKEKPMRTSAGVVTCKSLKGANVG